MESTPYCAISSLPAASAPLPLMGLKKEQVESLRLLGDGRPVPISTSWVHSDYPEILFADLGPDPVLPDPVDTVLEVCLKG